MKLSYWVAECLNDSKCYSLRAKTKKEVVALLASGNWRRSDYGPVKRVEFEYRDAFDLMENCLMESGGFWEV